jgi:exosome complex exonuclease DIS3/RRP44
MPSVSRYPHGHFVKSLGPIGEKEAETESLLLEHEVIHRPFSEKILATLPDASWHLAEADIRDRVDLRHLNVFSIDPPGKDTIFFWFKKVFDPRYPAFNLVFPSRHRLHRY